jgi:hypothetical protein
MRIILFDTLRAREDLVASGVPEEHATAQVKLLAEIASIHPDDIATRDYIDERLARLEARLTRQRI